MKKNILIVEDESLVAIDIKESLEELDYQVVGIASTYKKVTQFIENFSIDLILMDINLNQDIDGIDITNSINKTSSIPVVYLTAFTDNNTIQRAVETEPVGYIVKPFDTNELHAVLQLGLFKSKKNQDFSKDVVILNKEFYYDNFNEKLFNKNTLIKLSKNENTLLKLLIDANNNAVSYREIEYHIWPDIAVNNDTLRALVYRLRSKLNFHFIETIPYFGYKLIKKPT